MGGVRGIAANRPSSHSFIHPCARRSYKHTTHRSGPTGVRVVVGCRDVPPASYEGRRIESTGESAEVPSTASRSKKGHNTALSTRCPSSPSIIYQSVGLPISPSPPSIVSDVEQRSYNPIHPAAAATSRPRRQHRSASVATVECVRPPA